MKNLEELGYAYDECIEGYVKELYFDYNARNLRRGLATLLYFNDKLHIMKGRLYRLCENREQRIDEEIDKLKKYLKIDNLEIKKLNDGDAF